MRGPGAGQVRDSVVLRPPCIMVRLTSRHDTTIVLVGDTKVGKSSLLAKFRCGKFDSSYSKTNFESVTTSSVVQGQRVKFTIYDTSGKYQNIQLHSAPYSCHHLLYV